MLHIPSDIILSDEKDEKDSYISVDDVRISPKQLVFGDAFECRKYSETITIQNCGRKAAFVRILQPSSYAFKIKTVLGGKYLPPGLKLVRAVQFKYMHSSIVTLANLPIIVNGNQVDFKLKITFSVASIAVIPSVLDFGKINVGDPGAVKTVVVQNNGTRGSQFAFDTRLSEDIQMIIYPTRGLLAPGENAKIKIQLAETHPGEYEKDIYINAASPVKLTIKCTVLEVEFIAENALKIKDFVIIDFPYTYFGSHRHHYLIMANINTKTAMFCVLVEYQKELRSFEETLKIDENLKHFHLSSLDGLVMPDERKLLPIEDLRRISFVKKDFKGFS